MGQRVLTILVTNDDGVRAKGLEILVQYLKNIELSPDGPINKLEIKVIAPETNCSGYSNSITLKNPLRATKLDNGFIQVNGTPTDCIKIGLSNFFILQPSMVISGINHGANMADDILYSGTVGAAMEGRYLALPPIAISSESSNIEDLQNAAQVAANLVKRLVTQPLKQNRNDPYILNVNVPKNINHNNINDNYQATNLNLREFAPSQPITKDPMGAPIRWLGPSGEVSYVSENSDIKSINEGKVSITPIKINMTAHYLIDKLESWFHQTKFIKSPAATEQPIEKAKAEKIKQA